MSRVTARAFAADDRREATDGLTVGGLQRGGGAQGPQVLVRAPQGLGREREGASASRVGEEHFPGGGVQWGLNRVRVRVRVRQQVG